MEGVRFLAIFLILFLEYMLLEATDEPVCYSRFDYEKLLTKLVKLEHKVHMIQEKEAAQNKRIEELEDRLTGCVADIHKLDNILAGVKRTAGQDDKTSVGFHASGLRNLSPETGDKLIFWNVTVNTGSGYDVNTGIFSAPVDGMYWFSTQICNNENLGIQFLITVNDNPMTNSIKYGRDATCTSASMAAKLSSGDQVFVQTGYMGAKGRVLFENVHRECMFSGILVN